MAFGVIRRDVSRRLLLLVASLCILELDGSAVKHELFLLFTFVNHFFQQVTACEVNVGIAFAYVGLCFILYDFYIHYLTGFKAESIH